MVIDTLSIEFQADTSALTARLSELKGSLDSLREATGAAESAGAAAGSAFAAGISGRAGAVRSASAKLTAAAKVNASSIAASARTAGAQVGQGFANGISSKAGAVQSAIRRLTSGLTDDLKRLLGIHSPSTVAASFGRFFGEGFALGIGESEGSVASAAAGIGRSARRGLEGLTVPAARTESAASAAAQSINLTVPLQIDGYKLGEACIRGINAVTRSTGRVLLEL